MIYNKWESVNPILRAPIDALLKIMFSKFGLQECQRLGLAIIWYTCENMLFQQIVLPVQNSTLPPDDLTRSFA